MLALSTAWNASLHEKGEEIAEEILRLGFKNLELNFSLTKAQVEEIDGYRRRHDARILSLHNYCPIPAGLAREEALPDCYSLASTDENERKEAVAHTENTISTARRLDALAVVLHSGRVEIEDKTRQLIDLANRGKKNSDEYRSLFDDFVRERKKRSADHFHQLLKSLDTLSSYAVGKNILLGLENRFYYREIPSFDEFGPLFEKFKARNVMYWHDVGHAFILEKLGFMKEDDLLRTYGAFLGGFHLHNIKNLVDHQAPINGDFDFRRILPYISKKSLKVIEAHQPAGAQEIKASASLLQGIFP